MCVHEVCKHHLALKQSSLAALGLQFDSVFCVHEGKTENRIRAFGYVADVHLGLRLLTTFSHFTTFLYLAAHSFTLLQLTYIVYSL